MDRRIFPVMQIDQTHGKHWTATVQILECHHVQHMTKDDSEYKRIMMMDQDGTTMTGLIFSDYLGHYATIFSQFHKYNISGATVIRNDPKFSVGSYPFSWILTKSTLVEEIPERIPTTIPWSLEFTKFSRLHAYAESENLQNVRGIVLQCLPSQEHGVDLVTRRDIIIINEEKILLHVTLWKEFDEHEGRMLEAIRQPPLIFGLRLKVTTFNSISLTTRPNTAFMINPPVSVSEDLQLRKWYLDNRTEIDELLRMENHKNTELLLPYPPDDVILSIGVVTASPNIFKTAWIKGRLGLSAKGRRFSYTGCSNCHKALEADTTWVVMCPSCKVVSDIEAMIRATVTITDESGSIEAMLTTPHIEKFLLFNPEEVKTNEEIGMDIHNDIAAALELSEVVAFVQSKIEEMFGNTIRNHLKVAKVQFLLQLKCMQQLLTATTDIYPTSSSKSFKPIDSFSNAVHANIIQTIGTFPSMVDFIMEILSDIVTKQPVIKAPLVSYATQPDLRSSLPRSVLVVLGIAQDSQSVSHAQKALSLILKHNHNHRPVIENV
ncbi:unnamed protein product [Lactuca virosa]|uniref:Replication factor A C-terminal domain-containing protein n=1 Tax=Lactuca virosa TaxID=75947 RepID=A0AAU9PKA4_9ASTR|nr:unnamed protein product [Lactuca virosa]